MRNFSVMAWAASFAALLGLRAEVDPRNFDASVKPQDDFYQYVNGGWMKANPIPADQKAWSAGNELLERNRAALHAILERSMKATNPSPLEKLVGDFYASGMDLAARDTAGVKSLQPDLERIAAIKTTADVQAVLARLHTQTSVISIRPPPSAGFKLVSETDPKDSNRVIASAGQSGLGLPDRDYYLRPDEKSKVLVKQYAAHVAKLLALAGESPAEAQQQAEAVVRLETALAKGSRTNVELRDPVANYNRMTEAELQKLMPHFDWRAYFVAIGLPRPGEIDVGQPGFFSALDVELAQAPVTDWQAYLRWHLVHAAAPDLGTVFLDEQFAFYDQVLQGQPKPSDLWKRVQASTDSYLGEALGQLYVQEYFPPASKARMLELVHNLQASLKDRLEQLPWMDEPTRAKALAKLAAFSVKIGYPDKWLDYATLRPARATYAANVTAAKVLQFRRDLAKIGQPVDHGEWAMTPPTVNAYYNPQYNEIVFPAGILQPPFFDPKADDAVNYGAIGVVIGHEMTHGFDDQGRQFDAAGNLTDWWTPESAKRFTERSQGIVRQFDGYVAIDDLHVNGKLTTGENIADLGGMKIAYAALQKALKEHPAPAKIDGFTPEQRFFLGYAAIWRTNMRPEAVKLRVQTDPHSPARFRVIGPISNLEEFYSAFTVPEGAPMRRAAADRVTIW